MWAGVASILLCLMIHPSHELPQGSQIPLLSSLVIVASFELYIYRFGFIRSPSVTSGPRD
jgi:hypothetical protein